MFVVEVWTARSPSVERMSVGRPESGSVIATMDSQVSTAYRCSVSLDAPGAVAAPPAKTPSTRHPSATAADPVRRRASVPPVTGELGITTYPSLTFNFCNAKLCRLPKKVGVCPRPYAVTAP